MGMQLLTGLLVVNVVEGISDIPGNNEEDLYEVRSMEYGAWSMEYSIWDMGNGTR